MLATAIMAGFGFFFWLINTKIFSTEDIGLATTLISVVILIGTLSQIGFDMAFVRYLANSNQRNETLNTGLILVGITAFFISILFISFVGIISPSLSFITGHLLIIIVFIIFCISFALSMLIDSIFLSDRQTKYTLITSVIFSTIKMLLPFAFIGYGATGIFIAAATAHTIGFILSFAFLLRKSDYKPKFIIAKDVMNQVRNYCASNYIAGILNLLPTALLPIIVINHFGPKQAAYYYMAMMIGNLLYTIPWATTKSLFSEGSRDKQTINSNIQKSIKIIGVLLLPAIIVILIAGSNVLAIFGKNYSEEGISFLRLIAITGIIVSVYSIYGSLFKVREDLQSIILVNIFYAVIILALSYALLPFGLFGIGVAWLIGHIIASIISAIVWKYPLKV
jgi:O-antigen/teichoic acid export membrane protein